MTRAPSEPVVVVDNVTFSYSQETTPSISEVSFAVNDGDFFAIEGPTGAGKTTLALTLNGIIPHSTAGRFKGSVTIGGVNTKQASVADLSRTVGVVYQDPESQLFGLTVEEDVAFGLENLAIPREEMHERAAWALEAVDLADERLKSPSHLSGGQKQRLAIASVLAMRPRIMVLDEPTAELDPIGKESIFRVVRRLSDEYNLTIILIEHECDFVAEYADQVALIRDGRIVQTSTPRRFYGWIAAEAMGGVRIPQVTEVSLRLERQCGVQASSLPLTVAEACESLLPRLATATGTPSPAAPAIPEAREALLSLEGVRYVYPDGTVALDGVDLVIGRGDYLALIGQNGSGKTTLARHLNGLLRPADGRILLDGQDIAPRSVAELSRSIGYVFQNPDHQLFADSVVKEVAFGPTTHGLTETEVAERVDESLKMCGIERLRDEHPLFTSRGERQLIAIASVLAIRPPVIVFDEPTTGLDETYYGLVLDLMDMLRSNGHTIVVITHDMRLVAERCERAVALKDGRILADAATRELFDQPALLADTRIAPPQVTQLSHALRPAGVSTALAVDELVADLAQRSNATPVAETH